MTERDHLELGARRLDARQRLEALVLERTVDGAQPVRPLGMAGGCEMVEAGGVGDQKGRHWVIRKRGGVARYGYSAFRSGGTSAVAPATLPRSSVRHSRRGTA